MFEFELEVLNIVQDEYEKYYTLLLKRQSIKAAFLYKQISITKYYSVDPIIRYQSVPVEGGWV